MNRKLFALITFLLISASFSVSAAEKSIIDTLNPAKKDCNYVDSKLYQPFSGLDNNFPGSDKLVTEGKNGTNCINVEGGTEKLIKMLFNTGISIIIALSVIMIAVSGIQFMTEEAVGKKGAAKKRLYDSIIALALGLLSYTILYTINKQLVDFTFNPTSIDLNNSIAKGIDAAIKSAASSSAGASFDSIEAVTMVPQAPIVYNTSPNGIASGFIDAFNAAPGAIAAPGTAIAARITSITNGDQAKATAMGVLSVNGVIYNFRSGGGGNGYLPKGTYTITNGRQRSDTASMMVDGFGYSFDLNDVYDPRTNANRSLLRIHPDGGGPGTIGCIGILGSRAIQEQFYNALMNLLKNNGGKYTITVS